MKQFLILILVFLFFNIVQLQRTEEVQSFKTDLQQEWGYTEVYHDVFLFWWFYMQNPPTQPLLIWLGFYSTAETNFNQYGPLTSDLKWRNNSLIYDYNILFIDSIAGAGFSYVKDEQLLTHSTHETTYDLLTCIKFFFTKFSNFEKSPVYIVADSFFGKIAPELVHLWKTIGHRQNLKYNLKGLIIGIDSYSSDQIKIWHNYDTMKKRLINGNQDVNEIVDEIENFRRKEFWLTASQKIDFLLDNYSLIDSKSLINSITAFTTRIIATTNDNELNNLMNYRVKKELKLQSTWKTYQFTEFIDNVKGQSLQPQFETSYEDLLKTPDLKIVLLNTPMDLKVDTEINTLEWINDLDWDGKDKWNIQYKIPFTFNNKIEGYKKNYKNVYQYSITKNSNQNFETNADFLRTVFTEVME